MKLISIDDGEHFLRTANNVAKPVPSDSPPANKTSPSEVIPSSMPPPAAPKSGNGPSTNVIVNGNGHVDGSTDKKPPPIPSRAPTTSLSSRPQAARTSITGMQH